MDLDRILSSDFTSNNKTKKLYHSNGDNDISSRAVSSIDYNYNHKNNIDGNSHENSIVANDSRVGNDYTDRSSSDVAVKSSVSIHHLMDEFHHLMEEIEGNSSNSTAGSYNGPNYTNSHDDGSSSSSSSSSSSGDHNYIINISPQTNAYHYNDNYHHHAVNEDDDSNNGYNNNSNNNNINTGSVLFNRTVSNKINNNHHHYSIGSNNDMDRDNQFDVDDYNNYPRDSSHDRYHDSGDVDDYAYHTVDDDANMKDYSNDGDDDNDDDMMDETNIFYPSSHSSDINGNNYDDGREEEQKLFNDFYQVGYDVEEYTAAEHDDHDHGNDDRYYRHRYDDDHGYDNVDDKYDGGRYDGKDDVKHESSSSDDSPSLFAELNDEESIASVDSLHDGIEDIQHDDHDDDGRYRHNRRHHHIDYNHYHNDDDHRDRRDDDYVNTDESNRESSSTAINRNVSWTDTSIVESSKDTSKAESSKDKNYRHVTFDSNVQNRSQPAMYNKDYNRHHHHGHHHDDARTTILVDGMNDDREGVDERSNNDRKSFEDNGSDEIGTDPSIRKMPLTSIELKDEVMKLRRVNASLTNAITAEKTTRQQLERRIDTMTVRRCYHCHNLYHHFH